MRARRELLLFGAAYLLYNAGRAVTNGDMDLAIANAGWVLDSVVASRPRVLRPQAVFA